MSTFYRQSKARRAAKDRKRMASPVILSEVAGLHTYGSLGVHHVQVMHNDEDTAQLLIVVDHILRKPRTFRGVIRCISEMVWNAGKKTGTKKGK